MKNFAILILSCDKYSDLWDPFFDNFFRRFEVNNIKVYLGANQKQYARHGVHVLHSGPDNDWSSSYLRVLEQINEDYIFVLLEDLFPSSELKHENLISFVNFSIDQGADYSRYWSNPKYDYAIESNPEYGIIERGAPYRVTVCGLWRRNYLKKLLLVGESPWKFEINGSYRSSYSGLHISRIRNLFEFVNLVEKGNWISESVIWAQQNQVSLNLTQRPYSKHMQYITYLMKAAVFNFVLLVPWRIRIRLMDKLRLLLVSY